MSEERDLESLTRGVSARGLLRIVAFNWGKIGGAIVLVGGAIAVAVGELLPDSGWVRVVAVLVAGATTYWIVASLLASWYVSDLAPLYRWEWIKPLIGPVARTVVVSAGFDAVGPQLREVAGTVHTVDVTAGCVRVRRSVRRQQLREDYRPSVLSRCEQLPLAPRSADTALLAFAAHEVHDPSRCAALLRELISTVRPGSRVVLVEHVRDLPNIAVFGPAAWHFRSRRQWRRIIDGAGLQIADERRMAHLVEAVALVPKGLQTGLTEHEGQANRSEGSRL